MPAAYARCQVLANAHAENIHEAKTLWESFRFRNTVQELIEVFHFTCDSSVQERLRLPADQGLRLMTRSLEIRALMVTLDPWLASTFADLSKELNIDAQSTASPAGVPKELNSMKYEAVLVDLDTVPGSLSILASVRESRSNKDALVFAVATAESQKQQAFQQGAHFVFQRPLRAAELRSALHTAYNLMVGERRRCFRCSAELSVLLTKGISGPRLQCTTMNISSTGVALESQNQLTPGELVFIGIRLPDGFMVDGTAVVIWDDKHGKSGLSLECGSPEMQVRLDSWLNSEFSILLVSSGSV